MTVFPSHTDYRNKLKRNITRSSSTFIEPPHNHTISKCQYVKYLKDILTKKHKFGEHERVMLTEESSVLFKKMPPRHKDPGIS